MSKEPFSTDSVKRQLDYCTFCPKMCRHACPVSTSTGKETWIPQAKMAQLGQLASGRAAWTKENADPLWACTGCRHCTVYCDHGNEPGLVLLAGRAEAVARGAGHPALAGYAERFRKRDERLSAQLQDLFPDRLADHGAIGFWPGCDAVGKGSADVSAALTLMDRVGETGVRLVQAEQACAGYPLLASGYRDLFRWHAGKVAAVLRGFSTVVINCSACLYTLRAQYPGEGHAVSAEIVSLAEFLAERRARLPRATTRKTVYYHDPCYHARYSNVIEAPRALLAQVAEVRELAWNKTDTECCGGAGMLAKTMPAAADAMAKRRLAEVQAKGGGMVVTSCGTCAFMLKRNAPAAVEVADLPGALAALTDITYDLPPTVPESDGDDED
jgi:dimethylglycine catabolism B